MNLTDLRQDYNKTILNRKSLAVNPFSQLEIWMLQAKKRVKNIPNAMNLATSDSLANVSIRVVLLQYFSENDGLVFFTNYNSLKANNIASNNKVALSFNWLELERQINITGIAQKISKEKSAQYFASRPRESQISTWASAQSNIITSKAELLESCQYFNKKFANKKVPLPDFWGGYRVDANNFEFFQGGTGRLHDRFVYKKIDNIWQINRLAP